MSIVETLKLHNFRCYKQTTLQNVQNGLIVLWGENGVGKTNILEAVSLLAPGRGLRGARVGEIQSNKTRTPWAVSAALRNKYGDEVRIGTGLDPNSKPGREKRTVRLNGKSVRSQAILAKHLACVWLTPQMDRLFIDSTRERRKFLDRLVFTFDPGHSGRVLRYENALSQRSKLLREGQGDKTWLNALEQQMAETAGAIAAARLEYVQRLQIASKTADTGAFPRSHISVQGTLEEWLEEGSFSALEVEERFKENLKSSRERDALTGGAQKGPHKSDLIVTYDAKNIEANQCSTGEQKALLIGIILAHSRLIKAEHGFAPILLLDEVAAHLDAKRRANLYEILLELGAQSWITGTEKTLFSDISEKAQFIDVENLENNAPK